MGDLYHARVRGLLLIVCLVACDDAPADLRAPIIESARPGAGARAGVPVTLLGRGFGIGGPEDFVTYGGARLELDAWSDREISLRIPAEIGAGLGHFVVRAGARVSAPFLYEVLPPPEADDGGIADADVGVFTP